MDGLPAPGDVVLVTRAASVQFGQPLMFRVIRVVSEWVTYHGWTWLHGYSLDERGDALAKRDIFVRPAGLTLMRPAGPPPAPRRPNQRPATQVRRPSTPASPPETRRYATGSTLRRPG
ncbi:hypothetical protein [Micromonospora yangpuensis]|uniref:Uncharacterized protein n=1 Tax=Micromonospora yangpuensis TaxID=683228 RepID=A0A1C6V1G8_9ACTN|nr:hypothetical protein [Micromonospora yangpuensis]GGL97723.1 hypothetical protein GCM10012279_13980 [Micromonospora yangpuensis]SCL60149.1 hypothetical protein GA0070617_4295 [Micromonospora yangpuensis]